MFYTKTYYIYIRWGFELHAPQCLPLTCIVFIAIAIHAHCHWLFNKEIGAVHLPCNRWTTLSRYGNSSRQNESSAKSWEESLLVFVAPWVFPMTQTNRGFIQLRCAFVTEWPSRVTYCKCLDELSSKLFRPKLAMLPSLMQCAYFLRSRSCWIKGSLFPNKSAWGCVVSSLSVVLSPLFFLS